MTCLLCYLEIQNDLCVNGSAVGKNTMGILFVRKPEQVSQITCVQTLLFNHSTVNIPVQPDWLFQRPTLTMDFMVGVDGPTDQVTTCLLLCVIATGQHPITSLHMHTHTCTEDG